jgi:hypothetical protein
MFEKLLTAVLWLSPHSVFDNGYTFIWYISYHFSLEYTAVTEKNSPRAVIATP